MAPDLAELQQKTGLVVQSIDSAAVNRLFDELETYDAQERGEPYFTAGDNHVAVGCEAANTVMSRRCRGGVVNVNEIIGGEIWIECHTKQSAFEEGINSQRHERRRQERPILDHTQRTTLLTDKQAAVRSERHRCRTVQPTDDCVREP